MHPRPAVVVAASLAFAALAGCGGPGKFTSEHATLAKAKLDTLKAATELDMARQSFLAGELSKAERQVTKALAMNPESAEAHVLIGRIQLEHGDMGKAVEALRRAAELRPDLVDAAYYLGVVNERLNRPEEALAAFQRAVELAPFDPQHAIAAGETLIDLGRAEEAEAFLLASKISANSPGIRQLLGHVSMIRGRYDEAVERFEQARLLAPDERAIAEDLVAAQMAAQRFAEAEFAIARLRRTAGENERRDLIHRQAECLMHLDRASEARTLYRELVRAGEGGGDVAAWIGLGEAATILGDEAEIRRAASRLVSLAPARPEGYVLWALAHGIAGDDAKALKAIEDGLAKAGPAADLHALHAMSLAQFGRGVEAQAALAAAEAAGGSDTVLSTVRARLADPYASAPTE